ncbi:MAG: helix-turn-helix domain-containing protein [Flavobacteriaceae bacterium]
MTIDETPIAERLIKARELRGLTTSQLARRLGVRTQTLRNWEEGTSVPRANRLQMLAGILNVSLTWLFGGVKQHAPSAADADPALLLEQKLERARRLQSELGDLLAEISGDVTRVGAGAESGGNVAA